MRVGFRRWKTSAGLSTRSSVSRATRSACISWFTRMGGGGRERKRKREEGRRPDIGYRLRCARPREPLVGTRRCSLRFLHLPRLTERLHSNFLSAGCIAAECANRSFSSPCLLFGTPLPFPPCLGCPRGGPRGRPPAPCRALPVGLARARPPHSALIARVALSHCAHPGSAGSGPRRPRLHGAFPSDCRQEEDAGAGATRGCWIRGERDPAGEEDTAPGCGRCWSVAEQAALHVGPCTSAGWQTHCRAHRRNRDPGGSGHRTDAHREVIRHSTHRWRRRTEKHP